MDRHVERRRTLQRHTVGVRAHGPGLQSGVGVRAERIALRARRRHAKRPRLGVVRADELDHELDHALERAVARAQRVAAGLAAGFLQRCDGARRRHAAGHAALRHVAAVARLLELVDLQLQHVHPLAVEVVEADLAQALVVDAALDLDEGLRPVEKFLRVYAAALLDPEARGGGLHAHFQQVAAQAVDVLLRVLAHGDHAEAARRARLGVEHVEHDRVLPVRVEAAGHGGVVLARVEQVAPGEFDQVQRRAAAGQRFFVVPVDDDALAGRVHRVVVQVLRQLHAAAAGPRVGPGGGDVVVVHERAHEEVAAGLNVGDARLPEQVQQVELAHGHVAEAVAPGAVPEHAVGRAPVLELVPPRVRPHLLKVRLFQHRRHDGRQCLRVRFILLAARQDHRLREAVHRVGVLRDNGVEQPRARRLYHVAALLAPAVAQILPVPQAVPLLVGDDARLERALAVLVPAQKLRAARHVVRRDRGRGHVRPGRAGCRTRCKQRRRIRRAVGHGVRFLVCHRLSFAAVSGEMVYITFNILREKETAVAVFFCLHN